MTTNPDDKMADLCHSTLTSLFFVLGKTSGQTDSSAKAAKGGASGSKSASGSGGKGGKAAVLDDEPATPQPSKAVFPGWTGKTPSSLLHEHCQKLDWEKPTFDVVKRNSETLFPCPS